MIGEDELRDLTELDPGAALNALLACRDSAARMLAHAREAESAQGVFAANFRSRKMPDTVTQHLKPSRESLEHVHSTVSSLCAVVEGAYHAHGDLVSQRLELWDSIERMYVSQIPPLIDEWMLTHGGVGHPEIAQVPAAAKLERNARDEVAAFNEAAETFAADLERSVRALRVAPTKPGNGPAPLASSESKGEKQAKQLAEWLVSKLGTTADNTSRLTDEEVAKLTAFLDEFGGDQKAMSTFFGKLPSGTLLKLLSGISWGMAPSSRNRSDCEKLMNLMRSGFAKGTASWSAKKAKEFAKAFQSAKSSELAALGQLFAGPPFPGPEVSLAAARALQLREKKDGDLVFSFPPGSGTPFDVTGAVFQSLGQYPDQAYAFLGKLSPAEFDRLYRDRDWRDDGFAGVNALLYGANQATGGITSHPADPTVQKRIAQITSRGLDRLLHNKSFEARNLSADGSKYLSGTIGLNLPGLTERPIGANPTRDAPDAETVSVAGLGEWFAPAISVDDFIKLLGLASSQPIGARVLHDAVSQYEQALLGLARNSSNPTVVNTALTLYGRLDGFMNGAIDAGALARASELDAENARIAAGLSAAIGLIPFPAASEALGLTGALAQAVDLGQGIAVSTLSDAGVSALSTDHAAEALSQSRADRDNREKISDFSVYGAVAGALNIPGVTARPSIGSDSAAAVAAIEAWLQTNRPTIDSWLLDHPSVRADLIARGWADAYGNAHDRGRP